MEPIMIRPRWSLSLAIVAMSVSAGAAPQRGDGRDADRAAIRAHIESICQAFIDGDVGKIFATHTEDWRGFLEGSRAPIKGIDAYMRANGIPWPLPANAAPRPAAPDPARTFKLGDFDVHFYTPDIAVVNFLVDFGQMSAGEFKTGTRYRIMDIYVRRQGAWNQAASHTVVDPAWRAEQMSRPATLPPPVRDQLLAAREAVWRAYFTNDQAQLDALVPAETIVLDGPIEQPFVKKPEILAAARRGAERGNKLVRLEFPKTEIQAYGNTAIVYTTYLYELESPQGQRTTTTGKATEIFVRRNGVWLNPGWHLTPISRPQTPPPSTAPAAPAPPASLATHTQMQSQFRTIQRWLARAAELMPEDAYSFRPSPEMRPFVQNIAHAARSNFGYCSNMLREPSPAQDKAFEASITTKAQAIKALADSVAFCDRFMTSMTAESLNATYAATTRRPDGATAPLQVAIGGLVTNLLTHQNEVYGYTAVYLRLKGIVPPSTAPPAGRGAGGSSDTRPEARR
jgi:ketosteroid isomerase-like protein